MVEAPQRGFKRPWLVPAILSRRQGETVGSHLLASRNYEITQAEQIMHTNIKQTATFISDSGLRGKLIIRTKCGELKMDLEDLISFAADKIRDEKISRLEQASDREVLFSYDR